MNQKEMAEKAYSWDELKKILSQTMTDIANVEEDISADDAPDANHMVAEVVGYILEQMKKMEANPPYDGDFILSLHDLFERYDDTLRKLGEDD